MEITFGDLWDRRWELHGAGRPAPGSLGHLRVPSSALFGAINRVGGSSLGCGVLVLGTHPLLPPDFPPSLFAPPSLRSPRAAARPLPPPGRAGGGGGDSLRVGGRCRQGGSRCRACSRAESWGSCQKTAGVGSERRPRIAQVASNPPPQLPTPQSLAVPPPPRPNPCWFFVGIAAEARFKAENEVLQMLAGNSSQSLLERCSGERPRARPFRCGTGIRTT